MLSRLFDEYSWLHCSFWLTDGAIRWHTPEATIGVQRSAPNVARITPFIYNPPSPPSTTATTSSTPPPLPPSPDNDVLPPPLPPTDHNNRTLLELVYMKIETATAHFETATTILNEAMDMLDCWRCDLRFDCLLTLTVRHDFWFFIIPLHITLSSLLLLM